MAYYSQNYAGILGSALIASFGEDVKWSVTGDLQGSNYFQALVSHHNSGKHKERKKEKYWATCRQ